jgi:hypothetical protein
LQRRHSSIARKRSKNISRNHRGSASETVSFVQRRSRSGPGALLAQHGAAREPGGPNWPLEYSLGGGMCVCVWRVGVGGVGGHMRRRSWVLCQPQAAEQMKTHHMEAPVQVLPGNFPKTCPQRFREIFPERFQASRVRHKRFQHVSRKLPRPQHPPRLGAAGAGASMCYSFIFMWHLPGPPERPGRPDLERKHY